MDNLPATKEQNPPETVDNREDLFIANLFEGMPKKEAAKAAGYNKSTCDSSIYTKFHSKRFKEKLIEYAISKNIFQLPDVLNIESATLKTLKDIAEQIDDPTLSDDERNKIRERFLSNVAKSKHTLKEIKQSTGLLEQDRAPGSLTINIDKLQNALFGVAK